MEEMQQEQETEITEEQAQALYKEYQELGESQHYCHKTLILHISSGTEGSLPHEDWDRQDHQWK